MGKRGSDLLKFIKEGLKYKRYINLTKMLERPLTFKICFPRKTTKLDPAYEQFLKDWRVLKRKPYKYSMAKQAVETALKKSDFLKLKAVITDGFIYQILGDDEILEKKKSKCIKVKEEFSNPLSVESSGYGSGGESGSFSNSEEELFEDLGTVTNEQFAIGQGTGNSDHANVWNYNFEELNDVHEPELLQWANPNDIIIDERNYVPQNNDVVKEEISSLDSQNADPYDPYELQKLFDKVDFPCEQTDWKELMNIDLDEFDIIEEKRPTMPIYQLKDVQYTEDEIVLVFSPNEFEEGLKEDSNLGGKSRIAVDNNLKEKIAAAVLAPLKIGFKDGEIHLCLKH